VAGSPSRTVIESPEFSQDRERIQPLTQLWDAFFFGLDWVLSRNPEAGEQVYGLSYWMLVTEPSPGMPRLRILYEFDDDTVTLLAVEIDEVDFTLF
jgi:hypothetical protein